MFSKTEELNYLTDLLLSASQWQCSENEPLSPLHLEVKDRIRRLTEQETINVVGVPSDQIPGKEQRAQSAPVRTTDEATRERKRRWAAKKYAGFVRVRRGGGKVLWVPREHVDTIQIKTGTGFKYIIKPEFESLYTEPTDGTSPS